MKQIQTRIINKHATEAEWNISTLVPLDGELIIYEEDDNYDYRRLKIGDGETLPINLPFVSTDISIDYNELSFDTAEIVIATDSASTTAVLGQAILGQLILN